MTCLFFVCCSFLIYSCVRVESGGAGSNKAGKRKAPLHPSPSSPKVAGKKASKSQKKEKDVAPVDSSFRPPSPGKIFFVKILTG